MCDPPVRCDRHRQPPHEFSRPAGWPVRVFRHQVEAAAIPLGRQAVPQRAGIRVAEDPHGPSGGPAELVGWLYVAVTPYRRVAHVGSLALGVDAAHASRGLGSALLESSRAEAARRGLRRLELTVMADNLRALNLYLRHGYQVEGLRRGSLVRQDRCIDEYLMAQLLEH